MFSFCSGAAYDRREKIENIEESEIFHRRPSDFYGRVKLANGQEVMHEVSLKKNTSVNILNSGVGEATEWNPKLKGTDLDPEVLGKQEKGRLDNFSKKNEEKIRALADKDPLKSQMKKRGLKCKCIRCREIGFAKKTVLKKPKLKIREYNASDGKEFFLSFESNDCLLGISSNNGAIILESG